MRLGFILGEIWTGLRRNLSMAISVILVTMVSVFLLGLGMLAQRQADRLGPRIVGSWRADAEERLGFLCVSLAPAFRLCGLVPLLPD
jgi:cell division protein FtsX